MNKLMLTLALVLSLLVTSGCQTTRPSGPADIDNGTICAILAETDALPTLTNEERALILQHFTRLTKDKLKSPDALKKEFKC